MFQLIVEQEVCVVIPPINWQFLNTKPTWQNQWFNLQEVQSQEIIGLREWLRQEKPDVIGDWWWLVSKHTKQELIKTEWTNTLVIARLKSYI
ncbi:hypothetical protein Sta7437_3624 [Stanieria cyanosphaera PCC 7437]|uniref:Uncharacterized protein n=1 Tax=Stanieria cyanosphaera (strain ATCC 29371 / PCC 7437) TaxID=111780 RepID=K9XZN2_STAC7|nr:hypothetical protein [Stanieria cyanosphaera]AFZ37122.1 hypothetical protein Sta7437_3624 [Stanieria cyanosphaera PCC 7437]